MIAVMGTFDTKASELEYLAEHIREAGESVARIDVSTGLTTPLAVEVSRDEVRADSADWATICVNQDRGESVSAMATAIARFLPELVQKRQIQGVISVGGGGGTAIATAGMRSLPLGLPKLMVSTLASGNTAPYVETSDIVMFPSVVDAAGLNRVSRLLLGQAAAAICAMVRAPRSSESDRPVIVASMFGNTTQCVSTAKTALEQAGFEVLVFHATGTGGRTMEAVIDSGMAVGVLEITTTEWADELVGGVLSAGPTRLEAAGRRGVPAVIVPGCLDMVNFGEPATVPARFQGRTFYHHNPQVTLMRTTAGECTELGRILAEKINAYRSPVTVLLPLRGISVISQTGGPFYDSQADAALFSAIRQHLRPEIPCLDFDGAINDPAFAELAATSLLELIASTRASV